jgi:transposase InsO family protein
VREHVSASTQTQALSALVFLCRNVLEREICLLEGVVRAKRPARLPVVLTRDEARQLFANMDGVVLLACRLLYGSGLRLLECLHQRVKDIAFERNEITVRDGKGRKDRVTMLPVSCKQPLLDHLAKVRRQHEDDLRQGLGRVPVPGALARKYPNADRQWGWQYVFPASSHYTDRHTGVRHRHHLHEPSSRRPWARRCASRGSSNRRRLQTSRKRVARSLRNQQLAARPKRRFVHTTNSKHNEAIAPNLLQRDFSAEAPNRVWVADTTYLPTLLGFIYLVVVIDLFSRKVVGWAVGDDLNAELSREAFRRAVAKRSPPPGLIFHSDRGSEFAAKRFSDLPKTVAAAQSMSRSGDCWDNAPSESFFSTVEFEFEAGAAWREAADSDPELFAFIEVWYNAERLHSHNGNRSPNEAEAHWRRDALAT